MSVKVLASKHPLRDEWVEAEVADGQTITEIIGDIPVHVWIDGREVPAELLAYTKPKAGTTLTVRPIPKGDNLGRTFAQIGLIIAVALVSYYVSPWAGTALAIGGNLAINHFLPPQLPSLGGGSGESFNRLAAFTGQSNRVAAFQAIPRLYGEFRFYPPIPMTALPFTELVGSDQYLRMYLVLGYGPLQIGGVQAGGGAALITEETVLTGTPIRIGETDIHLFDDLEFELGDPADITLYTNQIIEIAPEWQTSHDVSDIDTNADGQWLTDGESAIRTSDADATELSIDITCNAGLFSINKKGDTKNAKIQFKIEYRLVGAGSWTVFDSDWTITGSKRETFRAGRRWKVSLGQYDVQLTRVRTYHSDFEATANTATWTALRTIRKRNPYIVENTVALVIRTRATGQLQGRLENVNVEAISILPAWDSDTQTWIEEPTRVPAWIYADVLTGTANSNPLDKTQLNTTDLLNWETETEADGRYYDGVFDDNATVFNRAIEVATTGRASFGLGDDAKISVILDTVQTVPKMVISPRNSFDFSSTLVFPKPPHAYRVRFIDPDTYEDTERLVYDDGYDASNATRFEVLQTKGVKNSAQAWKDGRYHLAQQRLRPEVFTFSQDIQHLRYRRGDLLLLNHDVIRIGHGAGRIKAITIDVNEDVTELESDEKLFMESGTDYGIRIQKSDGTIATVGIIAVSPFTQTVTLESPVTGIQVGDHFIFGELDLENIDVKVNAIDPRGNFIAQISCVPAAPDILDAETGAIPDYDPVLTKAIDVNSLPPPMPTLYTVRSDETAMMRDADGSYKLRLMLYSQLVGFPGFVAQLQARIKNENDGIWILSTPVDSSNGTIYFNNVIQGDTYEIQVRAIREGKASTWTTSRFETIVGKSTPQPNVTVLSAQQNGPSVVTRWTQVDVRDLKGYELRYMSQNQAFDWDKALLLSEVTRGTQVTTALLPPGRWFIGIKAVDTSENYSITATVTSVIVINDNNAIYEDEQAPDWDGTAQGFDVIEQPWIENGAFDSSDIDGWESDSTLAYDAVNGDTAAGCLTVVGTDAVFSAEYLPVDVTRDYTIAGSFKIDGADARLYAGFACYDSQQRFISYFDAWRDPNKDSTLYVDAVAASTTVDIVPASENWFAGGVSYIQFAIETDGSDLPAVGRSYHISSIDKTPVTYWRLTLSSALTDSYLAGTKVGNSTAGNNYNYNLMSNAAASSWVAETATISGEQAVLTEPNDNNEFLIGTAFIRFLVLPNRNSGTKTYIDDVLIEPVTPEPGDALAVLKLSDTFYTPEGEALFFVDFGEGQNIGDSIINWTEGWNSPGGTWTIAAAPDGSDVLCALGDRGNTSSNAYSLIFDKIVDVSDVELVIRFWRDRDGPFGGHSLCGFLVRVQDAEDSAAGYYRAQLDSFNGDTSLQSVTTAGVFNEFATDVDLGSPLEQWMRARLRIEGTTVSYKEWTEASEIEPATWDIQVTDSALALGGKIGFYTAQNQLFVDWIGIAVGGATAPSVAVPSSGALAIYTAPFLDAGFIDHVRVWAETITTAPIADISDPLLEVRYAIGETGDLLMWDANDNTLMWALEGIESMWSAWGAWESWSVGVIEARLIQHRLVYDPAKGSPTILGFKPIVDVPPRSEGRVGVSVPASGLDVLFTKQFHQIPLIKLTAVDAAVLPVRSSTTITGFHIDLYNTSGVAVAGTVDWEASTE